MECSNCILHLVLKSTPEARVSMRRTKAPKTTPRRLKEQRNIRDEEDVRTSCASCIFCMLPSVFAFFSSFGY